MIEKDVITSTERLRINRWKWLFFKIRFKLKLFLIKG